MTTIETERLFVRRFKPGDWADLREYISKETVMCFEQPWDTSDEGCRTTAAELAKGHSFWAVELKETGKMIGHLYFSQIQPKEFLTWEPGYIFNDDYHGRGYTTEACRGILDYGFRHLGAHRVIARCSPENIPSWRLLERLQLRREGLSLQCVTLRKTPRGRPIWMDEYLYAILADEWDALL